MNKYWIATLVAQKTFGSHIEVRCGNSYQWGDGSDRSLAYFREKAEQGLLSAYPGYTIIAVSIKPLPLPDHLEIIEKGEENE